MVEIGQSLEVGSLYAWIWQDTGLPIHKPWLIRLKSTQLKIYEASQEFWNKHICKTKGQPELMFQCPSSRSHTMSPLCTWQGRRSCRSQDVARSLTQEWHEYSQLWSLLKGKSFVGALVAEIPICKLPNTCKSKVSPSCSFERHFSFLSYAQPVSAKNSTSNLSHQFGLWFSCSSKSWIKPPGSHLHSLGKDSLLLAELASILLTQALAASPQVWKALSVCCCERHMWSNQTRYWRSWWRPTWDDFWCYFVQALVNLTCQNLHTGVFATQVSDARWCSNKAEEKDFAFFYTLLYQHLQRSKAWNICCCLRPVAGQRYLYTRKTFIELW